MDTKLTIRLDKNVIERAKVFAKKNKISLSSLIENYFITLTQEDRSRNLLSPTVQQLAGVLGDKRDVVINDEKYQYLAEKYIHE